VIVSGICHVLGGRSDPSALLLNLERRVVPMPSPSAHAPAFTAAMATHRIGVIVPLQGSLWWKGRVLWRPPRR